MIVDARAIRYEEMINLVEKRPVNFHSGTSSDLTKIPEFDRIAVISVVDVVDMPKIFESSVPGKVCSLVFNDCEPQDIPNFIPNESQPEFMTEMQAKEVVDFVDDLHQSKEKILLLVNCKHGMCRSGAIVAYTGNVCSLGFWNMQRHNPQIVPNHWVLYKLFEQHFKKKAAQGTASE